MVFSLAQEPIVDKTGVTKLHGQFTLLPPIGIQAALESFADNLPLGTHVFIIAQPFLYKIIERRFSG